MGGERVPYGNLAAQYQALKPEIDAAIQRVLESSQFVLGKEVAAFEAAFASYCGVDHAVAVNSGTSALHLALLAAGVGPGDEVVTVPFTFVATVAAITYTGARPVLVDVDPETLTMDPDAVEAALSPRTRALLPVHLHGRPADMDRLSSMARRRGLVLIEDAAQAHGAEYGGRRAGSLGDLACFSFYPGKNLGACGEGGMVVTRDASWAGTIRMLRDWGQDRRYHHVLRGFNYRMEGLQGAVLGVKLAHLESWNEARRTCARRYDELLAESGVALPAPCPDRHVYHVYAIRGPRRDELQRALADAGVETGIHYPVPVHLQPAFADLGYRAGDFPHAERAAREVLSLPMFPELTEEMQSRVATRVTRAVRELT